MTTQLRNLSKLPEKCLYFGLKGMREDTKVICIHKGIDGYTPIYTSLGEYYVNEWNKEHGVSENQKEAMLHGSMFGWATPGADPETYEKRDIGNETWDQYKGHSIYPDENYFDGVQDKESYDKYNAQEF